MKVAIIGALAGATAGLALFARKSRVLDRPNVLTLVAPFIDSSVADDFLMALDSRRREGPQLVLIHTLGGYVTPCAQIAKALLASPVKVSAVVPISAYSGGTLIALSASSLAMGDCAALSAVDPILDNQRARHLTRIQDESLKRDAEEHFSAVMGLLDEILDRQFIDPDNRPRVRELFDGQRYPHGWPLTRSMLNNAGLDVAPAHDRWSQVLRSITR